MNLESDGNAGPFEIYRFRVSLANLPHGLSPPPVHRRGIRDPIDRRGRKFAGGGEVGGNWSFFSTFHFAFYAPSAF